MKEEFSRSGLGSFPNVEEQDSLLVNRPVLVGLIIHPHNQLKFWPVVGHLLR